jgi:hypothetical protein
VSEGDVSLQFATYGDGVGVEVINGSSVGRSIADVGLLKLAAIGIAVEHDSLEFEHATNLIGGGAVLMRLPPVILLLWVYGMKRPGDMQ